MYMGVVVMIVKRAQTDFTINHLTVRISKIMECLLVESTMIPRVLI